MTNRISIVSIDAKSLVRSEKNKNARERAITDLLDENIFSIGEHIGPFSMHFEVADNKCIVSISVDDNSLDAISIPLSAMRRIIKDYHIICESYYDAVKEASSRRIEAIDMGRRGVHNEGAEILEDLISDKVEADFETYRKLFTLLYVLQIK